MQYREESVLDPLTGLLNRMSLEARFAEIAEQAGLQTDQSVAPVGAPTRPLQGGSTAPLWPRTRRRRAQGGRVRPGCASSCARSSSSTASAARSSSSSCGPGIDAGEGRVDVAERRGAWPCPRRRARGNLSVTISIGVAAEARGADVSYDALFRPADAALYEAKRAGRNRVALAGETAPPVVLVPGATAPVAET